MRFEGNQEVLRNLFRKKKLLEAGDVEHYNYRTALLGCSGVMRGVYGGGQMSALERFGLTNAFDTVVGISTGAALGAFFVAGQMQSDIDVFWKEGASAEFVSFKRFLLRRGPLADTTALTRAFRRRLDQEKAYCSRTNFFTAVTCAETGAGKLLNAKLMPDLLEAVHASFAMPGLCGKVVDIDGEPYLDGAGAMSFPSEAVVEQLEPTDLLVLANCTDEHKKDKRTTAFFNNLLLSNFPEPVRKTFNTRHASFPKGVQYLRNQTKVRWGILWTDAEVGYFEFNPQRLMAGAKRAEAYFAPLLQKAKVYVDREHQEVYTRALAAE